MVCSCVGKGAHTPYFGRRETARPKFRPQASRGVKGISYENSDVTWFSTLILLLLLALSFEQYAAVAARLNLLRVHLRGRLAANFLALFLTYSFDSSLLHVYVFPNSFLLSISSSILSHSFDGSLNALVPCGLHIRPILVSSVSYC